MSETVRSTARISCRRARIADFLGIAALDHRAWRGYPNAAGIPDGEHTWRIWAEHALVFCAITNNKVIGAALAFPCRPRMYCIHKILVARRHRGKGIASKLMALLLREMDRLRADCFLTVNPANEPAVRLYATWGFTGRQFVKGFYRRDEDRFVLTRRARTHRASAVKRSRQNR